MPPQDALTRSWREGWTLTWAGAVAPRSEGSPELVCAPFLRHQSTSPVRAGPCPVGRAFPFLALHSRLRAFSQGPQPLSWAPLPAESTEKKEVPEPARGMGGGDAVAELTSRGSCEYGGRRLQAEGPAWAQAGWHQLCWRLPLWNV